VNFKWFQLPFHCHIRYVTIRMRYNPTEHSLINRFSMVYNMFFSNPNGHPRQRKKFRGISPPHCIASDAIGHNDKRNATNRILFDPYHLGQVWHIMHNGMHNGSIDRLFPGRIDPPHKCTPCAKYTLCFGHIVCSTDQDSLVVCNRPCPWYQHTRFLPVPPQWSKEVTSSSQQCKNSIARTPLVVPDSSICPAQWK